MISENAAVKITNLHETIEVLEKITEDNNYKTTKVKAQKEFLKKNLPQDGKSSIERTGKLIEKLSSQ